MQHRAGAANNGKCHRSLPPFATFLHLALGGRQKEAVFSDGEHGTKRSLLLATSFHFKHLAARPNPPGLRATERLFSRGGNLRRAVTNDCHTRIGGIFIQKRKLILQGFSN
ncbi:hypothetical protein B4113_2840 [Geobacillus sp. B4113_201601]|nr:hypothetical protein B4113_2840 [Geobacillus sp. B4113_201601]